MGFIELRNLAIRYALTADFDFILSGHKQTAEMHRKFAPDHKKGSPPAIEKWLLDNNTIILVAETSKELSGYIVLQKHRSLWRKKHININDIFVAKVFRKSGIASAMLERAEELSRELRYPKTVSQIWSWNMASIRTHLKAGFKETASVELSEKQKYILFQKAM